MIEFKKNESAYGEMKNKFNLRARICLTVAGFAWFADTLFLRDGFDWTIAAAWLFMGALGVFLNYALLMSRPILCGEHTLSAEMALVGPKLGGLAIVTGSNQDERNIKVYPWVASLKPEQRLKVQLFSCLGTSGEFFKAKVELVDS